MNRPRSAKALYNDNGDDDDSGGGRSNYVMKRRQYIILGILYNTIKHNNDFRRNFRNPMPITTKTLFTNKKYFM